MGKSGHVAQSRDCSLPRDSHHRRGVTEPHAELPKPYVRDYRDLLAWQRAVQLAAECHRLARRLPREELDLGRQLRRAAVSVPANIAEGNGRFSRADYLRHLSIANGSLKEAETHLRIAQDCGFLSSQDVRRANQLATDTGRLLIAMVHKLRKTTHP